MKNILLLLLLFDFNLMLIPNMGRKDADLKL